MKNQRLYKAHFVALPDEAYVWLPADSLDDWDLDQAEGEKIIDGVEYRKLVQGMQEPEGWKAHALAVWGPGYTDSDGNQFEYRPFFWPSTDKIYRSRSSAQAVVNIITRWGGKAVLLEAEPIWTRVTDANHRRKRERLVRRAEVANARASAADLAIALHDQELAS